MAFARASCESPTATRAVRMRVPMAIHCLVGSGLKGDERTSRDVRSSRVVPDEKAAKWAWSRHVTWLPTELIRERRLALGLTQEQAADQTGIDRTVFNGIENGRRGVGPRNAARLASVLGGSADEYLTHPVRPWAKEIEKRLAELEERLRRLEGR